MAQGLYLLWSLNYLCIHLDLVGTENLRTEPKLQVACVGACVDLSSENTVVSALRQSKSASCSILGHDKVNTAARAPHKPPADALSGRRI